MLGPDIEKLDAGTYSIPFGEVFYKPVNYAGGFKTFGDVDAFMLELTPTLKERWAKNNPVSTIATSVVTRLDSSVSMKIMQHEDFAEAISFCGTPYAWTQDPGDTEIAILSLVPGEYYHAGVLDVVGAAFEYASAGGLKPVPANMVKVADGPFGWVRLLDLPQDAQRDANGQVAGTLTVTVTAITAADNRSRVDIGSTPRVSIELVCRNLSTVGTHSGVWLRQADMAQDGGRGLITANEDFEGIGLKGKAIRTGSNFGFFQRLKKIA